jgi:serine/threonine-protein kinase
VAWGGETRRLRVGEVSHGAVFLCSEGELPPLLTRLVVPLRADGRVVPVTGEVVRHVSAAQAGAWKMRPGFAVQLQLGSSQERLAADALAARLRSPAATPAGDRQTIDGATALRLLESLEQRAAAGHYELLDLPGDVGLPEAREKARGLRRQVEDLRVKLPPQAQVARVAKLLERIEQAALVLGAPGERLLHDARRGNFRGVARCVTAGLPPAVVASRRAAFLAERPGQEARAQQRVARSQVARKMGNAQAALSELEAALQDDPLNLALHQQHAELEQAARKAEPA